MWHIIWIFGLSVFLSLPVSFGFVVPPVQLVSFECQGGLSFLRVQQKKECTKSQHHLNLFGMFGGDDSKNDFNLELIRFSNLEKSGNNNINQTYSGLVEFLKEWSLFLEGKKSGITTPIQVSFLKDIQKEEEQVDSSFGVKLSFQRVKSSYNDDDDDDKKEEKTVISEGGVLIVVTQTKKGEVTTIAKRCDIEEGTLIKEMSEETIIQNLKDAITAWKKEQASSMV